MDIRRIPLLEGRNATYMNNDLVRAVIEDQGDVVLELSAKNAQGGMVNALSLPYFRGQGAGVLSDPNKDFWKLKQDLYQAGGIYFTFPSYSEAHINTISTYWSVYRYGSQSAYGGLWRLSRMKSREECNRFSAEKLELMIPGHPVLYTLCRVTNTSDEDLQFNASFHSMLSPPFLESGCLLSTSRSTFSAFAPNLREVAFNRLKSGIKFNELKSAPALKGSSLDASYIPGPTGSYDYIMGELASSSPLVWYSVINPRQQLIYLGFAPSSSHKLGEGVKGFDNIDFAMNYAGRMDTPWALFEGGTPQLFSLTAGFGAMDHHGAFKSPERQTLSAGESKLFLSAHAFTSFDNPRIGNGFYTLEKADHGLVCKRTKSYAYIQADYDFKVIRELASRLFED